MASPKPHVLIVDDEAAILTTVRRFLGGCGFDVDCASELEEAEALLIGKGGYDLIIADLSLAGASGTEGLELVRFVRLHAPEARIVMFTAYGAPNVELEARRRGVDRFLQKPVALSEIAAIAAELTGRRS